MYVQIGIVNCSLFLRKWYSAKTKFVGENFDIHNFFFTQNLEKMVNIMARFDRK